MLTAPAWTGGEECTPDARDTCTNIPVENRATMIGGNNVMPTMSWTPGPEGTTGYALVFQDLTNGETHWVIWGIPADVTSVGPDNIPSGSQQVAGFNSLPAQWFGTGSCCNAYELGVYALSGNVTATQANAIRDALDNNTGDIVLEKAFGRVAALQECTSGPPCN